MKKTIRPKKHLLVKQFKIVKFLKSEDYNNEEIAEIVNSTRLKIFRILKAGEKYKKSAKNLLKD